MNKKLLSLLLVLVSIFCCSELSAQVKKKAPVKKVATKGKTKATVVKKAASVPEPKLPVEKFTRVKISTDFGDMVVKLYNKTPQHRDNFIKLVSEHFYDSLLFHRVISNFMIQGGDPNSKYAQPGVMLGNGDVGYKVPAEFDSTLVHKKGALCAARDGNPEKASSGCQFYIVQGKPVSEPELDNISMRNGFKYSSAQRMTYKMNGGTPFLDNNYTVFGEVETGMEVVDKIAAVQKGAADRPVQDVRMKMEIIPADEKAGKK
ncbi:MAG TPA: peptidylprolyl isomerase [Ferruginibacter sp.]|nr:peptidylprolyl isomerase [Ferruginibacter sp.]HPH90345.1 peptidylprolyl isomerase [Ferruginibacter sp.]